MNIKQVTFQLKRIAKKTTIAVFSVLMLFCYSNYAIAQQSKEIAVDGFDSVIISPHIEVIFREGNTESVTIENITVPMDKLNVVVKNKTLKIYLDGAKVITKNEKKRQNGYDYKKPLYNNTVVTAVVTYKNINTVELRGEQRFDFEDAMTADNLRLKIYGESQVYFSKVNAKNVQISIYGESVLEIAAGSIEKQKITAYGETKVNTSDVQSIETKLTAYGDGVFQLNVSEKLKITSYGEATIVYSGSPELNKGIVIGETEITRMGS